MNNCGSDARDYCVCARVVHSMLANVRAPRAKKNLSVRCDGFVTVQCGCVFACACVAVCVCGCLL